VVNADRQVILVRVPQLLEDEFGQEARVGEDQRGPVGADRVHKLWHRPGGGVPAPGDALLHRQQDIDFRRRAGLPSTSVTAAASPPGASHRR
jgi:hypothetical protein